MRPPPQGPQFQGDTVDNPEEEYFARMETRADRAAWYDQDR
jgi:hypothetical protein